MTFCHNYKNETEQFINCNDCPLFPPCKLRDDTFPLCHNELCNGRLGHFPRCYQPARKRLPAVICRNDDTQESIIICISSLHQKMPPFEHCNRDHMDDNPAIHSDAHGC